MAKHLVKCRFCGERFDTNVEAFEMPKKGWYYHPYCLEKKNATITEEEKEQELFWDKCREIFGKYDFPQTKKLAEKYIEEFNFTYSGMAGTLEYFYIVQGNSTELSNGSIGIIPYQYEKAKTYFANKKNIKKNIKEIDFSKYIPSVRAIEIEAPYVPTKVIKLFNLEDDE